MSSGCFFEMMKQSEIGGGNGYISLRFLKANE